MDIRHNHDILIIGAGMGGLTAAVELKQAGRDVLVIDKGRGVGGRMATRRIGDATFDHGAQFMTARDPRFAAAVGQWLADGVVEEWYRSPGDHLHWRGMPTMSGPAKHLAGDVEVRVATRIVSLRCESRGWAAKLESGETIEAKAVLLTPPVPQSLALLEAGGVELDRNMKTRLESIEYERCLAVMAVLDGPSRIPQPGYLAPDDGPIAWIADNQLKGISRVPAVTIHASHAFSLEHWDRDRTECGRELLQAAELWLGSKVTDFQVHGWRYSKPVRVDENPCVVVSESPPLVIAGDAFAGPRVEGAALSGWAAAEELKKM